MSFQTSGFGSALRDGGEGDERLRPAPALFDAALFRRFAGLPRPAVYALCALLLLGGADLPSVKSRRAARAWAWTFG